MSYYDWIALVLLLVQYTGYQLLYFYLSHRRKVPTREAIIRQYREDWLYQIIETQQPILAIQTIRNLTMSNTFLISLSMILMGGIISIFSANLDWISAMETGRYIQFIQQHPMAIKLLVALFLLLISAFNFTFALRILYNMNFTMSASVRRPEHASFQLEQNTRQARHFITGVRALYYFLAPMIWILDTTAMIAFTLITTVLFYRFDFLKGSTHSARNLVVKTDP